MGWGRWFGEDILSKKNELMSVIIDRGGEHRFIYKSYEGTKKTKKIFYNRATSSAIFCAKQ